MDNQTKTIAKSIFFAIFTIGFFGIVVPMLMTYPNNLVVILGVTLISAYVVLLIKYLLKIYKLLNNQNHEN